MFGTILKKKVTDEKLANVFINGIISSIDSGFPLIAEFINEDPAFVKSPNIGMSNLHDFSLIVFVGNLAYLEESFDVDQVLRVESLIYKKLANVYDCTEQEIKAHLNDIKELMIRLNRPSKNMIYGMS